MPSSDITLSIQEADRLVIIGAVVEKRMKQCEAAMRLGLTDRQVRRLAVRYERDGSAGLASRRRGHRAGNAIAAETRDYIIRTLLPAQDLSAADCVRSFKALTRVERAFRTLKTDDLQVRPIWSHRRRHLPAHGARKPPARPRAVHRCTASEPCWRIWSE